jgi:hypothetical protein
MISGSMKYGSREERSVIHNANGAWRSIAAVAHDLLHGLVANGPPRDREVEATKARARATERFRDARP